MILSVSRRTDIPCYYSRWFMNRIRAGSVLIRNPMNQTQISRLKLSPDVVDCIVFWSKDPSGIMKHLDELDALGYKYYFQFTLTPYGRELEPGLRPKEEIVKTFLELSQRIGRDRVVWRYDPIILNHTLGMEYHKEAFAGMCESLKEAAGSVTISFVDLYAKMKGMEGIISPISNGQMMELGAFMGSTAAAAGLTIRACSEQVDLSSCGIGQAACVDKTLLERICGGRLSVKPDKGQRPGCGCYESVDIGIYNTCPNGCVYCYANYSQQSCRRNVDSHDPAGELLIGRAAPDEMIKERKTVSCLDRQIRLF